MTPKAFHATGERRRAAALAVALLLLGLGASLSSPSAVWAADDRPITDDERSDDDDTDWAAFFKQFLIGHHVTIRAPRAVGLTADQTARLSAVVDRRRADRRPALDVRLRIYDENGNTVAAKDATAGAGQVVSLDLRGADLGLRIGERQQIYAGVEVSPRRALPFVAAGLELFDTGTGLTDLAVPVPVRPRETRHPRAP